MKRGRGEVGLLLVLLVFFVEPLCGSDISEAGADLEEVHAFVSKVDPVNDLADDCICYNATDYQAAEVLECRCFGKDFREVPIGLDESVHSIIITDSDIKLIERDSFQPYRFTLQDVTLGNLPQLRVIEAGTFRNILNLRTVYISHTPQVKYLNGVFDAVIPNKILSLRIVHTGLMEIPDLSKLVTDSIMHMIDLDSNNIQKIGSNSIKVMADLVTLSHNAIKSVDGFAFNGSHIAKLILRGNRELKIVDQNAFNGLKSLQKLDLSETAIEQLPIQGIREIDILKVEKTPTMKVIPSVYEFQNLREAHLTHHFHCCAFKYPEQHDPKRHMQYQKMIEKICRLNVTVFDTGQIKWPKRNRRDVEDNEDIWGSVEEIGHTVGYDFEFGIPAAPSDWTPNLEHMKGHPRKTDHSHLDPLRGRTIEIQEAREVVHPGEVLGTFHQSSAEIPKNNQIVVFCGNLTISDYCTMRMEH